MTDNMTAPESPTPASSHWSINGAVANLANRRAALRCLLAAPELMYHQWAVQRDDDSSWTITRSHSTARERHGCVKRNMVQDVGGDLHGRPGTSHAQALLLCDMPLGVTSPDIVQTIHPIWEANIVG